MIRRKAIFMACVVICIKIVKRFLLFQSAQRRIRAMVAQASAPSRHRRAAQPPPAQQ